MKANLTKAYICITCRKVFKRIRYRRSGTAYIPLESLRTCPQCRHPLFEVGDTFKAPPIEDKAAWTKIAIDIRKGRRFVRDEAFGIESAPSKRLKRPKGVRSLFQLSARKRKPRNRI